MNKMLKDIFKAGDAEVRFFVFLFLGLSLLMVTSYVVGSRVERKDVSTPSGVVSTPFPEVAVRARAAYVLDARTGEVLFAKNEDIRMPLASLTKIMTALVATELGAEFASVTVTETSLGVTGDSGLMANERWNLKDLLDFSLIASSNDGMRAVALSLGAINRSDLSEEEILNSFVNEMNKKAAELELKNTYFWNETGLDESEVKGGAYGTARDITILMEYILANQPMLLEATRETKTTFTSLDEINHTAQNTNNLAGVIPGLRASKTGYTNTAGGNLTLAFDPELGRPIIVTVMGSTESGRFEDARALINATLKYINQN